MCTNCRAMFALRQSLLAAVERVKHHRDELAAKTAAAQADGGFDCCDSSEVTLCEAILSAADYLGCQPPESGEVAIAAALIVGAAFGFDNIGVAAVVWETDTKQEFIAAVESARKLLALAASVDAVDAGRVVSVADELLIGATTADDARRAISNES